MSSKNRVEDGHVSRHRNPAEMNDYDRIATAIRYLDSHQEEQPDLATLAATAGLSTSHFHRLFAAWAGVTPKDFLQCLTAARIREALRTGASVLDAALDAGLSGPGRIHDLCITLEAASPGELKSGGAGWTVNAGFAPSPFGECLIAESPRGICHLSFIETESQKEAWNRLAAGWPAARLHRNDAAIRKLSEAIFVADPRQRAPLRVYVRGSAFQLRVWRALLQIPTGALTTYGRLAQAIERPSAARAVGTAVGSNSIAYLIPCHRVIRETGVVGEYRWGRDRKRLMLARELSRP